jgi:hypothetical protein
MSDILRRWRAQGRECVEYPDKFIKRSLAPDEYDERIVDPYHYSSLNMRKLQNKAECLKFVARETTVLVPRVLATYERDGSFILKTERIHGVLMQDLKPKEQLEVMPQIRDYLQKLHRLRSNHLGGPSGIICPPQAIILRPNNCKIMVSEKYLHFRICILLSRSFTSKRLCSPYNLISSCDYGLGIRRILSRKP